MTLTLDEIVKTKTPEQIRNELISESRQAASNQVTSFLKETGYFDSGVGGLALDAIGSFTTGGKVDPDALARKAVALGASAACSAVPGVGFIAAPLCGIGANALYTPIKDALSDLFGGSTSSERAAYEQRKAVQAAENEAGRLAWLAIQTADRLKRSVFSFAKQWILIRSGVDIEKAKNGSAQDKRKASEQIAVFLRSMKPVFPFLLDSSKGISDEVLLGNPASWFETWTRSWIVPFTEDASGKRFQSKFAKNVAGFKVGLPFNTNSLGEVVPKKVATFLVVRSHDETTAVALEWSTNLSEPCASGFKMDKDGTMIPIYPITGTYTTLQNYKSVEVKYDDVKASCVFMAKRYADLVSMLLKWWGEVQATAPLQLSLLAENKLREANQRKASSQSSLVPIVFGAVAFGGILLVSRGLK